jgi:hypothetical protein
VIVLKARMFVGMDFVDNTPGDFSTSPDGLKTLSNNFVNGMRKGSKIGDGS